MRNLSLAVVGLMASLAAACAGPNGSTSSSSSSSSTGGTNSSAAPTSSSHAASSTSHPGSSSGGGTSSSASTSGGLGENESCVDDNGNLLECAPDLLCVSVNDDQGIPSYGACKRTCGVDGECPGKVC